MSQRHPHFHFCNLQYYPGANPYLKAAAITFDWTGQEGDETLAITDFQAEIGQKLSHCQEISFNSWSEAIAGTVLAISQLEMDLHLEHFSVTPLDGRYRFAVQALHEPTSRRTVQFVADWLTAIARREGFDFSSRLRSLQERFRRSPYGGPTSYALLRAAYEREIPTFYLPEERLMQYGYGKYQVRGISTTFDGDSHLDSDFTTFKDDCKDFLARCGFPVPQGAVVSSLDGALAAVAEIGYPVAVKPVVGHKGIGVTANIQDERGLILAFEEAAAANVGRRVQIIVEQHLAGGDFRLLCVGGKFVAAVERRPPHVIGDGRTIISALIERENATPARLDSPTSALSKIIVDEAMADYLQEQGFSLSSIPEAGQRVFLRKIANISAGGVSVGVSDLVHPENQQLAAAIAQYFRLTCLGIDVITEDISRSWREGNLGIIEINAAPGVFMHLNPALGESVDVPSRILEFLLPGDGPCRMPILTCNRLGGDELCQIIESLLQRHPHWLVGGICREGVWLNQSARKLAIDYNGSVGSLLRHPQLDFLIAEYPEAIFEEEGMAYEGSNWVVLEEPTATEKLLARDILPGGKVIFREKNQDIQEVIKSILYLDSCINSLSEQ